MKKTETEVIFENYRITTFELYEIKKILKFLMKYEFNRIVINNWKLAFLEEFESLDNLYRNDQINQIMQIVLPQFIEKNFIITDWCVFDYPFKEEMNSYIFDEIEYNNYKNKVTLAFPLKKVWKAFNFARFVKDVIEENCEITEIAFDGETTTLNKIEILVYNYVWKLLNEGGIIDINKKLEITIETIDSKEINNQIFYYDEWYLPKMYWRFKILENDRYLGKLTKNLK